MCRRGQLLRQKFKTKVKIKWHMSFPKRFLENCFCALATAKKGFIMSEKDEKFICSRSDWKSSQILEIQFDFRTSFCV